MSQENVSATGERAAMGGYIPQFSEFAYLVYQNLINKQLKWIRLADPDAEQLDDIQYAIDNEIHAYQVKWTISGANISYNDFLKLLPKLAKSWKGIQDSNPTMSVYANLLTNKKLSQNDSIYDKTSKKIGSFENFIQEVWSPIKQGRSIPQEWEYTVQEMYSIIDLDKATIELFFKRFNFEPDYINRKFSVKFADLYVADNDLSKLRSYLIENVADADRQVQYSREQILRDLTWENRVQTIFNHELILDRRYYNPINKTKNLLDQRECELVRGYIFLEGGPGSGKSSLLTDWSEDLEARVIRYYAFDFTQPASNMNFSTRGDAVSLFFDLVSQLRNQDVIHGNTLLTKDLVELKKEFQQQLDHLHKKFLEDGRKTIIIIDGLDHVSREYKDATHSLLKALPLPESIPGGVIIILGSQSYELEDLPLRLKQEYTSGANTILMHPLDGSAINEIIRKFDPSGKIPETIYSDIAARSEGHPLYLAYLIELLLQAENLQETLEQATLIHGDITLYYQKIWQPIEQYDELVELLGLVCRMSHSFSNEFLKELRFSSSTYRLFVKYAKFLFSNVGDKFDFFHNSFRQFLLKETALDPLNNKLDEGKDQQFHKSLAEHYLKSSVFPSWNAYAHFYEAKDYDSFLKEANPDALLQQYLQFRPEEEINKDALKGVQIGKGRGDILILIRYLAVLTELERRTYTFSSLEVVKELLRLGKISEAKSFLRTGQRLHCSKEYALEMSRIFLKCNETLEATILYNLALPISRITDQGLIIQNGHEIDDQLELIKIWLETATYFEEPSKLIRLIENLEIDDLDNRTLQFTETQLKQAFFKKIVFAYIKQSKWDNLKFLREKILSDEISLQLLIYAAQMAYTSGEDTKAKEYAEEIWSFASKSEEFHNLTCLEAANCLLNILDDHQGIDQWISHMDPPLIQDEQDLSYKNSFYDFNSLLGYHKLKNMIGLDMPITVAVPIVSSETNHLLGFQRMLCQFVKLYTDSLKGKSPYDLKSQLQVILRFYYRIAPADHIRWYKINDTKKDFFPFVIRTIARTGPENLIILKELFLKEFAEFPANWPPGLRQKIFKAFGKEHFFDQSLDAELSLVEKVLLDNLDVSGRVEACRDQANLYLVLEKSEKAESWLRQALQQSMGLGYRKDYQFNSWIYWLKSINRSEPELAHERLSWFLARVAYIEEVTEGPAFWRASELLMEAGLEIDLTTGLETQIWLINNGLGDFPKATELFLKASLPLISDQKDYALLIKLYLLYYLPMGESDTSLLRQILNTGYRHFREEFEKDYLKEIQQGISIHAQESYRDGLLAIIQKVSQRINEGEGDYALLQSEEVSEFSNSSDNVIRLENGEIFSEDAVKEAIHDVQDLKRLLEHEDNYNSRFKWESVLASIPLYLSSEDSEMLLLTETIRNSYSLWSGLGKMVLRSGHKELAWQFGLRSLENSQPSGWNKFYDGGSRLMAFDLLKEIDEERGKKLAFQTFSQDIERENYRSDYLSYLHEILPYLPNTYQEVEIWNEIDKYIQRLLANSSPSTSLPRFSKQDKNFSELVQQFLNFAFSFRVPWLCDTSAYLLSYLASLNRLKPEDLDNQVLNSVLIHLYERKDLDALAKFEAAISSLGNSRSFIDRENAHKFSKAIGRPLSKRSYKPLPNVYNLSLSELSSLNEIGLSESSKIIQAFDVYFKILNGISGISFQNLKYRAELFMKEYERNTSLIEFDSKYYEKIGLKFPVGQAQSLSIQWALQTIIQEFLEANLDVPEWVRKNFTFYDHGVFYYPISQKPAHISNLGNRDSGHVSSSWVMEIEKAPALQRDFLQKYKGDFIIAEYSRLRSLDWGAPTEELESVLSTTDQPSKNLFESQRNVRTQEYASLETLDKSLVIRRDHGYDQFDIRATWLAVNPDLARNLNWIINTDGLFSWKNDQGQCMAYSVFWQSGNTALQPRRDYDISSGWMVVFSRSALQQLSEEYPKMFMHKSLTRTALRSGRQEETVQKTYKLAY